MKTSWRGWGKWLRQSIGKIKPGYVSDAGLSTKDDSLGYAERRQGVVRWVGLAAVLSAIVAGATWCYFATRITEQSLRTSLHLALQRADYVQADESVDALLAKFPNDHETLWQKAFVAERLGQVDKAASLRRELASVGFSPAVVWLTSLEFRLHDIAQWPQEKHERYLSLFSNSSGRSGASVTELSRHKAGYWTLLGEPDKAIESLEGICQEHPEALVNIASLYMQMGDMHKSRLNAKAAELALRPRLSLQPRDVASRLNLVRALTLLSREDEALSCLAEGTELGGQPVIQQAAGEVLVVWARRLGNEEGKEATFWPRLQLIHRATLCAPQDSVVLRAAIELITECQTDREQRRENLNLAIAKGIEKNAGHTLLGWLYVLDDNHRMAQQHLRLALIDSPELPTVMNNISLALLERSDFTAKHALAMVDHASQLLPNQPEFAETRGRILITMGRWQEAIDALNKGLTSEKLRPQIYSQLAKAHSELGDNETATRFKQLQNELSTAR